MKDRYFIYDRNGTYYLQDKETGKRESLRTKSRRVAERLLNARNEAASQPQLNLTLGRAYLSSHDPKLAERTWQDVMAEFCTHGKESSQERSRRAFASKDFAGLRKRRLIETTSEDLLRILKSRGSATNNYLRRLHNLAIGLGWLHWPILAPKLWPKPKPKPKRAITAAEHRKLVEGTHNQEWRSFFEVLWETGAAQTDAANLRAENIDWPAKKLFYFRSKLKEVHAPAVVSIGPRLAAVLQKLPKEGFLFPKLQMISWNHRSAEFCRKCRVLKIEGVSLHSYRYSWAERAKACGLPERFAMANLGHNSQAVHQSYAKKAVVECPSLEEYEAEMNRKIVRIAV